MATFLLIHGGWQGAWCWHEIIPRLEREGHNAFAIDLPAHGNDRRAPADTTFEDYVEAVCRAIESSLDIPIVVGHSLTAIISEVAETIPDRVRALVYVAGHLLAAGQSMLQMAQKFDPEYLSQLLWAPDRRTARMDPQGIRRFLYPLCPSKIVEEVLPKFTAEPIAPFEHPIQVTPEKYGRVPRYYVECLQDRVVPLAVQRRMHSTQGCKRVYSIDTDHSPFFSAPDELVSILKAIANDV